MEDINKKGFNFTILFIVLFVVASIIILLIIWWPKSATKKDKIVNYVSMDGKEESLKLYLTNLKELLTVENSDKLFEKMDLNFLAQNNLNKDNFKEYMENNKYISKNPIISGSSVSKQSDDVYIYRIEYLTYGGLKKYVNIIETKPYVYTLSFEQENIPIVGNKSSTSTYSDILYTATIEEIKDNSITYILEIKNNGDKVVKYNFDNVDNVYLVLNDNKTVKLGAAVVSSDDDILTLNGIIRKEFFFQIGTDYHESIKQMVIKSIEIDGNFQEVTINLK